MRTEILKKYALMKHKTAVLRVIAHKTNTSFAQISQRWFNTKQDYKIPEQHHAKIIEIIDIQLRFEIVEKKHYESFN